MAADDVRVEVKGLRDLQRALNRMEEKAGPELRKGLNDVAEIVLAAAKAKVPVRSGRAAASMKTGSTQRAAQIKAGGRKAEYYPWLDFGGRVGKGRTGPGTGSVHRPFLKEGRYIYPTLREKRAEVTERVDELIRRLALSAGFDTQGKL